MGDGTKLSAAAILRDLLNHIAALEAEIARLTANTHTHMREMEECEDREKDQRQRAERAEAEVARLTPSGQVAEDEAEAVREFIIAQEEPSDFALDALARLAAKANGYDAAMKDLADERSLREATHDELHRCEAERDAAVADNAALLETLRLVGKSDGAWGPQTCTWCGCQQHADRCPVGQALSRPHPGAVLLEEHRKALEAIEDLLHTARKYDDKPHHLYSKMRMVAGEFGRTAEERMEAERQMDAAYAHHDEHRKALVRARNEGLDVVRKEVERQAAAYAALTSDVARDRVALLRALAADISDLREPEL